MPLLNFNGIFCKWDKVGASGNRDLVKCGERIISLCTYLKRLNNWNKCITLLLHNVFNVGILYFEVHTVGRKHYARRHGFDLQFPNYCGMIFGSSLIIFNLIWVLLPSYFTDPATYPPIHPLIQLFNIYLLNIY